MFSPVNYENAIHSELVTTSDKREELVMNTPEQCKDDTNNTKLEINLTKSKIANKDHKNSESMTEDMAFNVNGHVSLTKITITNN